MKRKDDEFFKMSIGVRRDMEDKMRIERTSLKEALTTTNKRETDAAVDRCKLVSILNVQIYCCNNTSEMTDLEFIWVLNINQAQ